MVGSCFGVDFVPRWMAKGRDERTDWGTGSRRRTIVVRDR